MVGAFFMLKEKLRVSDEMGGASVAVSSAITIAISPAAANAANFQEGRRDHHTRILLPTFRIGRFQLS